jgi:hypothetical protein
MMTNEEKFDNNKKNLLHFLYGSLTGEYRGYFVIRKHLNYGIDAFNVAKSTAEFSGSADDGTVFHWNNEYHTLTLEDHKKWMEILSNPLKTEKIFETLAKEKGILVALDGLKIRKLDTSTIELYGETIFDLNDFID